MKPKYQRLLLILIGMIFISCAIFLILRNFDDNLVFFYSPHELSEKNIAKNTIIRIGGLVEAGTVKKAADGKTVEFYITDLQKSILVRYKGILPPMFREGQGMIAKGKLVEDMFEADNLLTKHDEKYMPPEVAKSLKKSGKWK